MSSENSAVVALSHLWDLEADRVRRQQQARRAAACAERLAAERMQQQEREAAERRAAHEAARLHDERMAELERERHDRLRVEEAEARARIEHEARLRQEQMRLDAQVRLTERKARPRWPMAVIPVLVVGLVGMVGLGWHSFAERENAERESAEQIAARQADALAQVRAKLGALEARQAQLQQERSALLAQIAAAKDDDAVRAELERKLANVDASIAQGDGKRSTKRPGKSRPRWTKGAKGAKGSQGTKTDKSTRTRPRLELGGDGDPLSGLKG
ncbi:MAG: hypothetical protein AAGF11_32840 [Myxococcota bacterium]